jgi:hypothetical protein
MSNKKKIYAKGHIPGKWTAARHELLDAPAWKHSSFGARLLYIALLRNLSFTAYNNGNVFLATRKAAEQLGASQRVICVWFRELEHYGFIVTTKPGTIGPKGEATRYRITDMDWGELDGKPIRATKDYLQWTGELFEDNSRASRAKRKRLNRDGKYSGRVRLVLTADDG